MTEWQQLWISVNGEIADGISDALTEAGAVSTTLQDAQDQALFAVNVDDQPLWQQTWVIGLFPLNIKSQAIVTALKQQFGEQAITQHLHQPLAEQDWANTWKQYAQPQHFANRLWVCPSWVNHDDLDGTIMTLDPGMAFGTGSHPTTAMCLQWLAEHIDNPACFIDYGCGSGILAIAAIKLGAKDVWAIDNDPQAITATIDNAQRNGLNAAQINTALPGEHPPLKADIIIANILANPLIELAPQFAELIKPSGQLILSGILAEQIPLVEQGFAPWFQIQESRTLDEWVLLVAQPYPLTR